MHPNRQRFRDFFTTSRAYLRSAIGRYFNYCPTSLRRFVGQQVKEHTPTTISYASGQISVPYHAFNIQILYIDSVICFYVQIGHFMQKIFALVDHLLMGFSDKNTGLVSPTGAFLFTRQRPLPSSEKFKGFLKVFRVLNLISLRVKAKRFNTYINTYFSRGIRKFLNGNIIAGESNKPLTCGCSTNSHGFNIALNRPGQKQFESTDIFNIEASTLKTPARLFKGKRIVSIFRLESWKSSFTVTFFKALIESLKSFIQSLKNILEALRTNGLEFRKGLFKFRQLRHLLIKGDRFTMLFVDADSLFKGEIVEGSTYLKPLIAISLCGLVYLCLIKIGFSHFLLWASMYFLIISLLTLPTVLTKYDRDSIAHINKTVHRKGNSDSSSE